MYFTKNFARSYFRPGVFPLVKHTTVVFTQLTGKRERSHDNAIPLPIPSSGQICCSTTGGVRGCRQCKNITYAYFNEVG